MQRRSLLPGAAVAALAWPAFGDTSKTICLVPQVTLNGIDPV